jgi:hypothetical protein
MENDADAIEYRSVRFDADRVSAPDGGRPSIVVPRDEIVAIELRHGPAAQTPIVQLVCGVALALVAVGLPAFLLSIGAPLSISGRASVGTLKLALVCPCVLVAGVCIAATALRRGYFLHVTTERGARKLVFAGKADPASLAAAVRRAEERLGYTVKWMVEDLVPEVPPYRS